MIVVIDYNVGNVKSVCNALEYIGCETKLSADPAEIACADGVILPGVAAFGFAMKALGDLDKVVIELAQNGKPLLGICVGFQLLFDSSCEHGEHKGLGLVSGNVVPIPAGRTIPHMGWNLVEFQKDMDLFEGLKEAEHFYFAHSYYADVADKDATVGYTEYGFEVPACVQKKNIFGVQFHPEKSGEIGLKVLQNFDRICKEAIK